MPASGHSFAHTRERRFFPEDQVPIRPSDVGASGGHLSPCESDTEIQSQFTLNRNDRSPPCQSVSRAPPAPSVQLASRRLIRKHL